jgi:hypothetical protein
MLLKVLMAMGFPFVQQALLKRRFIKIAGEAGKAGERNFHFLAEKLDQLLQF